jgi:hypothetical protein
LSKYLAYYHASRYGPPDFDRDQRVISGDLMEICMLLAMITTKKTKTLQ